MSACAGISFSSSTALSTSCMTNCMSRNGGVYWGMGRLLGEDSGSAAAFGRRCWLAALGRRLRRVVRQRAVEGGAGPLHRAGVAQEAGVVVQRQDQAVHLEHHLQRVGVRVQVALVDG